MRKKFYSFGSLVSCFILLLSTAHAAVPVINSNPKNDTVCSGASVARFSISTNHAAYPIIGVTYQWQVSTDGGFSWSSVTNGALYGGATTDSLNITSPGMSLNGYMFRTIVYNTYATDTTIDSITSITSSAAQLVVDSTYNGVITGPAVVCAGSEITLNESYPGGVWSVTNDSASVSLTGIVTGLLTNTDTGAGHDKVIYTISAPKCTTYRDTLSIKIYPTPNVGTITAPYDSLCNGATMTLVSSGSGGTWSASNPAIGSVSASGLFTSLSAGFDTVMYGASTAYCSASATYVVRVDTAVVAMPLTGPASVCIGGSIHLTDVNAYGITTWTSGNTAIATVDGDGFVEGVAAGSAMITYSFTNACNSVDTFTAINVDAVLNPGIISGSTQVCAGSWISLSETVSGGTWLSNNMAVAIADASGNVTGVSQGTAVISYFVANACGISSAMATVTVSASASNIIGNDSVGIGGTRYLYDTTLNGTWSSSDPAIISINSATGVAEGVGPGSATITYTVSNSCGSTFATEVLYTGMTAAGSVSGTDTVCVGSSTTFSDAVTGGVGVWSSSNTSVASVDGSGDVTGLAFGQATISYTYSNGFGSAYATHPIFVNAAPIDSINGYSIYSESGSYPFQGYTRNDTGGWVPTAGIWTSSNPSVAQFYSTSGAILTIIGYGSTTIKFSASNTCGTTDTSFVITIDAMSASQQVNNNASVLNVYPNPSNGSFTVNLLSAGNENVAATITNMVGEKVKEFNLSTNKAYDLQLNQPDGIYFLNATTSSGAKYAAKITVAR